MPAPSPSWNLVRVYGTWRNLDGTPKRGTYKVSIPVKITNATDDSALPAGTFLSGVLSQDTGSPSLDIMVPATDDPDVQQVGWQVSIEVSFADKSKTERFRIDVPYADRPVEDGGTGNGVNLRGFTAPEQVPVKDVMLKVGVAGGIALLDGTGSALNADGTSASQIAVNAATTATGAATAADTSAQTAQTAATTAQNAATAASATTDSQMAGRVSDPASQTRAAMASAMGGDITGLVPSVNSRRKKGDTITPDDFTGTDQAKLQAAVNYCVANSYPTILLDRMLDLTGQAAVSIDKTPSWSVRKVVTFEGVGGGITKNDSGVVFTSATANTGDITVRGVKFVSTVGAGTILWDGDKLMRISSSECEYRNWDRIFSQTVNGRWAQTIRFHKEHINAGAGPAITFRESYDVTIDDCVVEDREALLWNSDGTMTGIANRSLRITKNVIENMSGVPIKLAMCWPFLIEGNYFEQNGGANDPHIDLHTLAVNSGQIGDMRANLFQRSAAQVAAKSPAILCGQTVARAITSASNTTPANGVLWKLAVPTQTTLYSWGDYAEQPGGLVIHPGQEHRIVSTGGKTTTTAARPKNPRIGEPYFDTTLGKQITAKTAGTPASIALRFNAGATSAGDITITIAGTAYVVTVAAGDTLTQVRDRVVAAVSTFWPTWKVTASSTNVAAIDAYAPGNVTGALTFSGGTTGVTSDFFGYNSNGTNAVWVDGAGTTV